MDVDTRRLTGSTGILTQPVQDLDDFTNNPGKYLLDLYADEDGAAKAWTRAGESHHFRHNDGVITLAWDGAPLLGVPYWDDICTLWTYLVNVTKDYLATGRGESFFPDQPTPIVLEGIQGGALITIGDTKVRVDTSVFCHELLDEARRFWHWVDRHPVPIHGSPELSRIEQIRVQIPHQTIT